MTGFFVNVPVEQQGPLEPRIISGFRDLFHGPGQRISAEKCRLFILRCAQRLRALPLDDPSRQTIATLLKRHMPCPNHAPTQFRNTTKARISARRKSIWGMRLLEIEEEGKMSHGRVVAPGEGALLSIRNEAELKANVEITETWKLVMAAWFDDEAIASEVLYLPSEELWAELTAFGGQAMCPPEWNWIVDGGWAKYPLQIKMTVNGGSRDIFATAVGAWEWDMAILRIVVKHCAKRKFTGSTSDLFPLVRRILATWNTAVVKVAKWHGFVEQSVCHLYASLLYLQWQYSLAHDPHPELAEEAKLSGQEHFFKLLGVNAPPTLAIQSVAYLGQSLEKVMRAPPVEISVTAGFKGKLHDKLL